MESYAKARDEKVFDWNHFLSDEYQNSLSKTLDEYNWSEYQDKWAGARQLAGRWITCGCGQQYAIIPRNEIGMPLDEELSLRGQLFYQCIEEQDVAGARSELQGIEERSAELIQQLTKSDGQDPKEEQGA